MKLNQLSKDHIIEAANIIDNQGIPKNNVWSQYYVVVNNKEYPFKYIVKTAFSLVSNEELNFQSNDNYRNYINKDLGFKLNYYEGGYNFFTKEELDFYCSIVNTEYRKANKHQEFYGQKLNSIIQKTKYWAEQLIYDDFKLRQDGNWLTAHTSNIAPYFWPRIYTKIDKDVFFNVEVNGDKEFIGYKLDGYYETTKALPKHKIDILNNYKSKINLEWPKISFDDVSTYNWERLIKESRDYIKKYRHHHDTLKSLISKETKISRLTWNTNHWIKPSGKLGKSKSPSFELENGFGHEEWLFDGEKTINGYKYGFLEPIHKHRSKYIGQTYDISLYTRDSDLKTDFWITTLTQVEVISIDEGISVQNHYEKTGWFESMKEDLYNLNLNSAMLDDWIKEDRSALFNVKFKADQLNRISNKLIPVDEKTDIPSNRYILMDIDNIIQKKYIQIEQNGFSFEDTGSENSELNSSGKRQNNGQEIELELKHNILQEKLLIYLQKKFGKENVKKECRAYGASRIDVVRKTNTGYIFYEIKTYNSILTSLRNAIGQLIEYSLYPQVQNAEELIIVSHIEPTENIKDYINHIKKHIKLPFSYIHFDIDKEEIITKI